MEYTELRKKGVYLGRAGEDGKRTVWLDVTAWNTAYDAGAGVLLFTSPSGRVWPMGAKTVTDDVTGAVTMEAPVTAAETALAGVGHIEAQWISGGEKVKSQTFNAMVLESGYTGENVPDNAPGWVADLITELNAAGTLLEELGEVASEAHAATQRLERVEVDAQEAVESAEAAALHANQASETAEGHAASALGYKNAAAASASAASDSATAAAASAEAAMDATPEGYAAFVGSMAAAYSSESTYAVGDLVLEEGQLYECNTAITEGETWDDDHWTAVTVGGQLVRISDETAALRGITCKSVAWSVAETGKRQNYDDGTMSSNSSYAVTGFIDVSRYKYLLFGSVTSTASNTSTGAAFFGDTTTASYISGVPGYEDWAELTYCDKFVKVPAGAKYARFSLIAESTAGFHIEGYENLREAYYGALEHGGMYPGTYLTGWLQGTIKTDTGAAQNTTTKCRGAGYIRGRDITQNGRAVFTVKDGYTLGCRAYTTSAGTTDVYDGAAFDAETGTFEAEIDPDLYYRFVLGNSASETMAPEDVPADAAMYTGIRWTDKTLCGYGVPADASVAGEILRSIGSAIGNAVYRKPNFSTGGITQQGANAEILHRVRTTYLKIIPGNHYFIDLGTGDYKLYNAFVYSGTTQGTVIRQLPVIDGRYLFFKADASANYFRAAFYYAADPDGHTFTTEDVEAISGAISVREVCMPSGKQERTGTFEWFSVTVDRPMAFGDEVTGGTPQTVECVLQLPTGYTAGGTPTRLVLACHGAEGYIDSANAHWAGTGWTALMNALLSAGYAVFDVNVLPTSTGTSTMGFCVGSPLAVNVAKKAYDYIQQNYNVYREIFVHGTSMGGVLASAFSNAYPGLVLAESSLAGRDAALYFYRIENGTYGDSDTNFANAWGYETMAALKADHWSHIEGAAQILTLHKYVDGVLQYPPDRETEFAAWMAYYAEVQKHSKTDDIGDYTARRIVPYKTWESWGDNVADTKAKLILQKAYRANGCLYEVMVYDSYDHDDMGFGKVENLRDQLIAWYKRWE